jgi:hypothetical protein
VTIVRIHAVPRLTDFIASLLEWMADAAAREITIAEQGRSTNSIDRFGQADQTQRRGQAHGLANEPAFPSSATDP